MESFVDSLSQYKFLADIEEKTKVPREQFVLGTGFILFLVVFFGVGMPVVSGLATIIPPAIFSLQAIEGKTSAKEKLYLKKNWLTYWVIFGFFTALETFVKAILYFVPYYYALKVAILIWCMNPTWRGAAFVFDNALAKLKFMSPLPFPPQPPSAGDEKAAKARSS